MASHNIAQNLRDNNTNWQNVKQAIEDKGVSTTGLTTAEYDDAIRQISGGSEPVLDSVNITPSTVSQTITPPTGTDGYNEINVAAVDNTIDANIVSENIKNGVQILGITGNYSGQSGNYQSKTVTPAATEQIVAPDSGYDALSQVTVGAAPLQNKSVSPSTSQQTVNADSPNYGLGTVTVGAVDASIDSNITPQNIRKDIQILGILGTFEGATDISLPYSESQLYSDSSPVTYEWILGANVDTINITNSNEGGGTWNKPTSSNLSVSVKRTESGTYETLTEGTDYTLTVTGTSSGNYIYNIELVCNSYIYSVKVVYTNIYRVRGRLDTNVILNISYSDENPTSTTGHNAGDYWFVVEGNYIKAQYMFDGTDWVLISGSGMTVLKTLTNLALPDNSTGTPRALLNYNGTLYALHNRKVYEYDETNDTWTEYDSQSNLLGYAVGADSGMSNIDEDAVLIGDYAVWVCNKFNSANSYLAWYKIDTKEMISSPIELNLGNTSGYTGTIWCFCTDGSNIYVYERHGRKLHKVAIDFTNVTATPTVLYDDSVTQYGFRRLKIFNGELYAISENGLYKINVNTGELTVIKTFDDTTSINRDLISIDGVGLIFSGGIKDKCSLYIYDGSNIKRLNTSYQIQYTGGCYALLNDKLYRYMYNNSTTADISQSSRQNYLQVVANSIS